MNCQEFWDGMPELHEQGSGGLQPAEHEHITQCSACASRLEAERALTAGLWMVAADWKRVEAPRRLEARLLAAFRAEFGSPKLPRRDGWLAAAGWALAAAATLALAVALVRVPAARPPQQAAGGVLALAQFPADDGELIRLPNAAEGDADVDVVRLELPRSAMMAVGIAVSPERASEPVEAEVMLDADGLARAVRFVDQ